MLMLIHCKMQQDTSGRDGKEQRDVIKGGTKQPKKQEEEEEEDAFFIILIIISQRINSGQLRPGDVLE